MVTCPTASWSGVSWLTGPSRPVVATNADTPSTSGTPAATAAPNASSRISSVPPSENCMDFASSARCCAPSAFWADASPYSSTRSSGWARWTAATAATGASAIRSSFAVSAAVSCLPGSEKFTTTERPSCETVFARSGASSGLWMFSTPAIRSRRLTTSFTAAVTAGLSALIEPLPWMSTRSPIVAGKPASATIMSPRLDSPLPIADGSRCFWPTLPPMTVARTTNRIQPMMAVLRCVALHLPARAARLRGCIGRSSSGVGASGDAAHTPSAVGRGRCGLPASPSRESAPRRAAARTVRGWRARA